MMWPGGMVSIMYEVFLVNFWVIILCPLFVQ